MARRVRATHQPLRTTLSGASSECLSSSSSVGQHHQQQVPLMDEPRAGCWRATTAASVSGQEHRIAGMSSSLSRHHAMLFTTHKVFGVADTGHHSSAPPSHHSSATGGGRQVLQAWAAQMGLDDAGATSPTRSNKDDEQLLHPSIRSSSSLSTQSAYVAATVPPVALLVRLMAVLQSPMEAWPPRWRTASVNPPAQQASADVVDAMAAMVLRLQLREDVNRRGAGGAHRVGQQDQDDDDAEDAVVSSIAVTMCAVAVRLFLSDTGRGRGQSDKALDASYRATCEAVVGMLKRCVPWKNGTAVAHARRTVLRRLLLLGVEGYQRQHDGGCDHNALAVGRREAMEALYAVAVAAEADLTAENELLAMDALHVVLSCAYEWKVAVPVVWADQALAAMHAETQRMLSPTTRTQRRSNTIAVPAAVVDLLRCHNLSDLLIHSDDGITTTSSGARDDGDEQVATQVHRQLMDAVLFVRCSAGAGQGDAAAVVGPWPVEAQLQFIHKALRATKEDNCLRSVLAMRQRLSAQYPLPPTLSSPNEAISSTTTTPSDDTTEERTLRLLRLYCNGTALLQVGHMVDRCSDWTLDHFASIASIVQETVDGCLALGRESAAASGLAALPLEAAEGEANSIARPTVVVYNRAHEGLRLAMKCYVRARQFLEATKIYEQYPAMGPSWEMACCYSGCNEPFRAVVVFQSFLDVVVPKSFASAGVPAYIRTKLLAVVESAGMQAARWVASSSSGNNQKDAMRDLSALLLRSEVHQGQEQQLGEPPDGAAPLINGDDAAAVSSVSLLRRKFEDTVGSGVLKGIPPTLVLEKFVRGVADGASRPGGATSTLSPGADTTTAPIITGAQTPSIWVALLTFVVDFSLDRQRGRPCVWSTKPVGITRDVVEACCLALCRLLPPTTPVARPLATVASEGAAGPRAGSQDNNALLTGVLDVLHETFPRLNVWAIAVEWFFLRSGRPDVVHELLHHHAQSPPPPSGAAAPSSPPPLLCADRMLMLFDGLSHTLLEALRQHVSAATTPSSKARAATTTTTAALVALMDASMEQKHSFNALKEQWQCTYCNAWCPASAAACHVCSALKLHLWQCQQCNGFSPSTHPDRCLVCTAPRSKPGPGGAVSDVAVGSHAPLAVEASSTHHVMPLRRWTCKFCRTSNEPTHAFFCSGCKEPSWAAVASRAMVPFDCTSCGRSQIKGMLRPWCDHCGTVHDAARPSATVWSCNACFHWNPWLTFHCGDCHAPKPALAALQVERAWQPWVCHVCEGQNAAWRDDCGHCTAPRPYNSAVQWREGKNNNNSGDDDGGWGDEMVPADASMGTAAAADHDDVRPACPVCSEPALTIAGVGGDGQQCLSCGFDGGVVADRVVQEPTVWVCLRAGCLHINTMPPAPSERRHDMETDCGAPPAQCRCEKCGLLKGLTTTLASHTSVFRYKEGEQQPEAADDTLVGRGNHHDRNDTDGAPSGMMEPVDVFAPTAVGLRPEGGLCVACGEPLGALNLIQLCPECLTSSWHVGSGVVAASPSEDPTTELLLWLHMAAARVVLNHAASNEAPPLLSRLSSADVNPSSRLSQHTALAVVRVTSNALRSVPQSQLPWQGRDIANMRCAVSTRNPVHEPSGAPHSALQAVSALVDALVRQSQRSDSNGTRPNHTGGSRRGAHGWLLVALDLIDLVNDSTDFDELSFPTLSRLARAIQHLDDDTSTHGHRRDGSPPPRRSEMPDDNDNTAAEGDDDDASLDSLRLEYLISMKLPTRVLVGPDRCRDCLHRACICKMVTVGGRSSARKPRHEGGGSGKGGGGRARQNHPYGSGAQEAGAGGTRAPPPSAASIRAPHTPSIVGVTSS